jgi:hypothetical protein
MPRRRIAALLTLAVSALAPAAAHAVPTVTVTGDDGNPVTLNGTTAVGIRQMNVTATVAVPRDDTASYTTQVLDPAGAPASPLSACRPGRPASTQDNFADYRGNGTYIALVNYFSNGSCRGRPSAEHRFPYTIAAGTSVTPPPGRLLTRPRNSLATITHDIGVALNPGAFSYEVRYARGGVVGPDGAISGPSTEAFLNTSTGLAGFRFDRPGRYVIVARAKNDDFFTPWSAPASVAAVAPFDLERVSFPDPRGPRYKLRAQVRERAARGRVRISVARGRKGGRFRRIGSARINSKGRFTKRFRLHRTGVYRLRCTYRGSSLVAAGRVTERIRIRRRIFVR